MTYATATPGPGRFGCGWTRSAPESPDSRIASRPGRGAGRARGGHRPEFDIGPPTSTVVQLWLSSVSAVLSWVVVTVVSQAQVLARFGHALSDPTRCRLLLALRDGPAYPADLAEALGVSRTNLSNHLACLRGCGLVVTVPQGRRSRYELADRRLAHALGDLIELALAVDPDAECPVDADGAC